MRIAILGGGLTGLTATYHLSSKTQHNIVVYESGPKLGGLASGFQGAGWEWELERVYHHIFSSDRDIINLTKEIGYNGIFFKNPITASLYEKDTSYHTYAIDSPSHLLRFPLLSIFEKIRAGIVLGVFKTFPHFPYYKTHTTEEILREWMGENAYEILFGDMLRKKFGKYAGNILASFIWSRVHMRTKSLGYMRGGFQNMIDHLAKQCTNTRADIQINTKVCAIRKTADGKFAIIVESGGEEREELFNLVISTLPSPVLASVGIGILTKAELSQLRNLKYLSATNLIIEMEEKVFDAEYWVSICTPKIPSLVFVQHTNFVDKSHYNNHNLLYIASYCEDDDPLMFLTKEQTLSLYLPTIEKIIGKIPTIYDTYVWRAKFAQPIFDGDFLLNVPSFTTSDPRFFIANLDMTYPYDRGTNYAVRLGKDVANIVRNSL